MRCPHCGIGIHFEGERHVYRAEAASGGPTGYEITEDFCPVCHELIVILRTGEYRWIEDEGELLNASKENFLYPKFPKRFIDNGIPEKYRLVFEEAVAVLSVSPKASAALSRRLLQHLLRDEFKIQLGANANLDDEIQEFYRLPDVPGDITAHVNEIRQIGNWAAHPTKYRSTGEIVDVEPDEAEWLLDILEDIFDFRFVQPRLVQERQSKYDEKRKEIRR
jgi:hypothetical protein